VDFIYTDLKKDVEIKVPLILEGRAKGVQMGAQLKQEFRYLPLKCKPELIPESIKINVQDMMPGTNLRVKEVKLNQGIKIRLDPMTILVAVSPLVEQKQEEKEESVPSSSS
jgi:large subunit ribosomal protein L25